jgi:hypothetical protein
MRRSSLARYWVGGPVDEILSEPCLEVKSRELSMLVDSRQGCPMDGFGDVDPFCFFKIERITL